MAGSQAPQPTWWLPATATAHCARREAKDGEYAEAGSWGREGSPVPTADGWGEAAPGPSVDGPYGPRCKSAGYSWIGGSSVSRPFTAPSVSGLEANDGCSTFWSDVRKRRRTCVVLGPKVGRSLSYEIFSTSCPWRPSYCNKYRPKLIHIMNHNNIRYRNPRTIKKYNLTFLIVLDSDFTWLTWHLHNSGDLIFVLVLMWH